jgi:hypothetical protein
VNLPLPAGRRKEETEVQAPLPTSCLLKLRTARRAKLSQRTLRVYAGKRFVIHALQADSSRATTAAAVSP